MIVLQYQRNLLLLIECSRPREDLAALVRAVTGFQKLMMHQSWLEWVGFLNSNRYGSEK